MKIIFHNEFTVKNGNSNVLFDEKVILCVNFQSYNFVP